MYLLILLLIAQRLYEVAVGEKNFKRHEKELLTPLDVNEKRQMIIMHVLWFLSIITEYHIHGKLVSQPFFLAGLFILLFCQSVRFQTIKMLGTYWTHLPISFRHQKIVTDGPYNYLRHPNYLVVIIELALVPLLAGLYWSAIIFSLLNLLFITRRITIEERALSHLKEYQRIKMKKKLIPLLFSFTLLINVSWADNISFNSSDFKEAQEASTYFMFEGHSKKFGMVTTAFEGYAKKGELSFKETQEGFNNIRLTLDTNQIDTDNSMRDKKMQGKCLESHEYPLITVTIPEISKEQARQTVQGVMKVREKEVNLPIIITKKGNLYSGEASFSLTEADIPDPSIAIAKVEDKFVIKFQVELKENSSHQ